MYVIKRDGKKVEYDRNKVVNAINSAFLDVDKVLYETDTAEDIADEITILVAKNSQGISVEIIQDKIEEYLMRSERPDVARAYIRFRYKREVAREYKADFMKAVAEKLEARNVKNQNANVDEYSFGGRIGEAAGLLTRQYALDFCLSPMAKKNHLENMIYTHDLDAYAVGMHNCLSIPFDDLLANGFNTRQTDVRPAGSVNTAMQLVAVIFQLQSLQQFGGVSATHLDWTMVPYVRKSFYKHFLKGMKYLVKEEIGQKQIDKYMKKLNNELPIDDEIYKMPFSYVYNYAMEMTEQEIHQAVEGLYHNLNTLQSRSGYQLN